MLCVIFVALTKNNKAVVTLVTDTAVNSLIWTMAINPISAVDVH